MDSGNVRTLFISDVHLGSRHSQAEPLLAFLESVNPAQLFLVGDFIDGWQLQRSFRWQPEFSRVLERLHQLVAGGTTTYYVPGNHDAFLRNASFIGRICEQLGVRLVDDAVVFETADQRRFLVTHGDRFDVVERSAQWLSKLISTPYDALLSLNWSLSRLRGQQDVSPYLLCARGKHWVKRLIRFLSSFENSLLDSAREQGCAGVICGHVHTPAIITRDGMTYCNTGDWVENCTALIERLDGTLELTSFYPRPDWDCVPQSPARASRSRPPRRQRRPRRQTVAERFTHVSPHLPDC